MKNLLNTILVLGCLGFATSAKSVPIVVNQGDFSGSETVIDFNIIPNTSPITNQYSGSGVLFNGALVGLTNPGDTNLFNGSTIASNWIYSGPGNTGSVWEATFSDLITMVGFFSETNVGDSVTIEAFNGATSLGSLNFLNPNGTTPDFLGLGDTDGFDKIMVTTDTNSNGFFAMDDFRFEGSVSVPEPSILALFGLGLFGLGLARRRMRS